ncbi:MAG: glycosyltransferase family 2 protein [Candidatus Omnitrophota bacterium]|nr:glycosyltransferase family 2 protein [Candidatus Omnitrophota bacterium]
MTKISVVIPVYNEKESLAGLVDELLPVLKGVGDYEVLLIDDGSTDGSLEIIEAAAKRDDRIRWIRMRRNFGKSAALQCGFRRAQGNIVITMDGDLQDDPAEIPRFIKKLEEGNDLVSGWKKERHDPWHKTIPSKLYNFVTASVTGVKLHDFNCGFKAYRRSVFKEVEVYGELHRYIPVLAGWRGFRIAEIEVHHRARKFGKSKYGVGRLLAGLLDLGTAYYVTRFSKKPSRIFGVIGSLAFLSGLGINLHILVIKLGGGWVGHRQPYMMLGLLLTFVGIQLLFFGLLSELMVFFYHRFRKEYSIEREE